MEDGLVQKFINLTPHTITSLNPCCNGRWSRTCTQSLFLALSRVLILVVMEDGLVHDKAVSEGKEVIMS